MNFRKLFQRDADTYPIAEPIAAEPIAEEADLGKRGVPDIPFLLDPLLGYYTNPYLDVSIVMQLDLSLLVYIGQSDMPTQPPRFNLTNWPQEKWVPLVLQNGRNLGFAVMRRGNQFFGMWRRAPMESRTPPVPSAQRAAADAALKAGQMASTRSQTSATMNNSIKYR
jgi:hypothetical protein